MLSETDKYTIQQVAALTGLSEHTLRYYERIGLLTVINRATNGHRRYSDLDVSRIKLLCHLIRTKMPLEQVRRYVALWLENGDESGDERIDMLIAHREDVLQQLAELQETLALLDEKITNHQKKNIETQETSK
jgi:DNA-binding transcriptional MerR regulator